MRSNGASAWLWRRIGAPGLGRLDGFVTRSGYVISPVVAWVGDMAQFRVNPDEVERAFGIPLAHILSDAIVEWFSVEDSDRRALRLATAGDRPPRPSCSSCAS